MSEFTPQRNKAFVLEAFESNDCTTMEPNRDSFARSRSTLTLSDLRPSGAGQELLEKGDS